MAAVHRLQRLAEIDGRSLAAFRVGLGSVLLADIVQRAASASVFMTDDGVLPRSIAEAIVSPLQPSLHFASGELSLQYAALALAAVAAVALAVGYRARVAAAACLVLFVSIGNRTPALYHTADQYVRVLLWWALLCPIGRTLAVDARRRAPPSQAPVASLATLGLLLQVLTVYGLSTYHKWQNLTFWWTDGTMLSYVLELDSYTTAWGIALKDSPELLVGLTRASFVLEAVGPPLAFLCAAWPRARTAIVLAMIAFHAGTALLMEVGLFPYVSAVAWLAFVPGATWDKLGWPASAVAEPAPSPPVKRWPARAIEWARAVPAAALTAALVTSLAAQLHLGPRVAPLESAATLGGFTQAWSMFSAPGTDDGWLVVSGTFADGSERDLLTGAPVTWERPALISGTVPDDRWRTYLFRITGTQYGDHRRHFAQYWCRQYAHGDNPLVDIEVTYMQVRTRVEGGRVAGEHPPERVHRIGGQCRKGGTELFVPPRAGEGNGVAGRPRPVRRSRPVDARRAADR